MRAQTTLTMLAAAVGIPYTASETELGRSAMQLLGNGVQTVSAPAGDYLAAAKSPSYGEHAHRDVERIWESTVDRYRYSSTPEVVASNTRLASSSTRPVTGSQAAPGAPLPVTVVGSGAASGYTPSLVGQPVSDLREVLRFDISPEWITARFSRVTTVLAELELDGLRVPLVTGTGPNDLAGSLSYYFDHSAKLQRVSLHGFTGDPNAVIDTMTRHYGLRSEPSLEAGVYTRRWNGIPVHFLRITRAPIVYSDALHHKYTVYLELNQPDLRYGISAEAQRIVSADRNTGRW